MHLLLLLQQVVVDAAQISPKSITPTAIAVTFAGFVLAGFWREIHAFKRQVERWQSKIDTTLFGAEGGNGLNGVSKDHETRIRTLEAKSK